MTDDPAPRGRRWLRAVVALLVVGGSLLVLDATRPPQDQLSAKVVLGSIDAYQATFSKVFARTGVVTCRFEPTCSVYGRASVEKHGSVRGLGRALGRVARCHPGTPQGTIDPP